jgi:two-component sensor histidine kinase
LLKGISKLKETKAFAELGNAFNNLGAHYYYQFDYSAAIRAHKIAINYFTLSNEPDGASRALNNIGICYKNLKQPEKALQTYQESLRLGKKLDDPMTISIAYASISGLYLEKNDLKNALKYNLLSSESVDKKDNYTLITILFSRGEILMKLGRLDEAEAAFEKGRLLAEKTKNLERLQYFYKSLAELKRKQNKTFEAFDYLSIYDSLRDEMYDRDRNEFMAQYEKKFKLSEKELEATKEKFKRKQIQDKLKTSKRNFLGALIIIFALIALVTVITYAWKQRKEKNELDRKHIEQIDLLSKELHHRIKNNLQMVSSMLSIETRELDGETKKRVDNVINAMQMMSRIHGSLHNESGWDSIDTKELFEILKSQGESLKHGLICEMNSPDLTIDLTTGISIGLLLNELMTNSVKHAFSSTSEPLIKVSLEIDGKELILNYSDNGVGMKFEERSQSSFGSRFLSAVCKKLGGELILKPGSGYCALIRITKFQYHENTGR